MKEQVSEAVVRKPQKLATLLKTDFNTGVFL